MKMAFEPKYFEQIIAHPNRDMVLTRLGYRKTATILDPRHIAMLEEGMKRGSLLCRPAGAYVRLKLEEKDSSHVRLENGVVFFGAGLAELLKDSVEVVLMASTVGREITEVISREVEKGDAAMGVILDSVASQTADAAVAWIAGFIDKMLRREGRKLTGRRYSPGYGDLPLSYQKDIYDSLRLERLDMELTEKFMLIPEKSVIAIAGIEEVKGGQGGRAIF
jgi:hypothetical protein